MMHPFTHAFWLRTRTVTRTRPTWRLWAVLAGGALVAMLWLVSHWHTYLRINRPLPGDAAILLEGWSKDSAMEHSVNEWKAGHTPFIVTTGIPIPRGDLLVQWKDFAHFAEESLEKRGVPPEKVVAVPTPDVTTDRTVASAEAAKKFMEEAAAAGLMPRRFTIVTMSVHGRRTWRVYRRIFGPEWEIGIHSLDAGDYPEETWYKSSNGVKAVLIETIALVYDVVGSGK